MTADSVSDREHAPVLQRATARLARGAANAFLINIAGTGLAFLSQLLLARVLGVAGYGAYAYVMAWVTVLALLATLGFQTGMLRFVSAYCAREEWPLLRGVLRYAMQRVSLARARRSGSSPPASSSRSGDRLGPGSRALSWSAARSCPSWRCRRSAESIVRAFGGVALALAPQALLRPAIVLAVVGVWGVLLSLPIGPQGAMAVTLLATALASVP